MSDKNKENSKELVLVNSAPRPEASDTSLKPKKKMAPRGLPKNPDQAGSRMDGEKMSEEKFKLNAAQKEYFLCKLLETGQMPKYLDLDEWNQKPRWNVWVYKADNKSATRIIEVDEEKGLALEIDVETLHGKILDMFGSFVDTMGHSSKYGISDREASAIASRLTKNGRRIKTWPETVGFKDSPGLFFQRHPFTPPKKATIDQFPTIAVTLASIKTNRAAFCARIGSLYDHDASRKQIILMIGEGDSGKTTIMNLLRILVGGEAACASVTEHVYSSHGMEKLVDRRLWLADEVSERFFLHRMFKLLTGDSPVSVNPKGEKMYDAELKGMMFGACNEVPIFKDDSGIRNRIIICETQAIPEELRSPMSTTIRRMKAELPYFISYCIEEWAKAGESKTVKHDSSSYSRVVDDQNSELEMIFSENFEVDDKLSGDGLIENKGDQRYLAENAATSCAYHARWEAIAGHHTQFARQRGAKKAFDSYVKQRLNVTTLTAQIRNVVINGCKLMDKVRVIPRIKILIPVWMTECNKNG